jgi:hypothetical protein
VYDAVNSSWENRNVSVDLSTESIGTLSDVDITGVADGEVIVWNTSTSQFEPGSAGADLSTSSVGDLSDVDLTNLADGDILKNNAGTLEPVPYPTLSHISLNSTVSKEIDTETSIEFDVKESQSGDAFTHSTTTNNDTITVNTDGTYFFAVNIRMGSSADRTHTPIYLRVNGNIVASAEHTYIRNQNNHNESSGNLARVIELSSGDTVTVTTDNSGGSSTSTPNRQSLSGFYIGIPAVNSDLTNINSVSSDYTVQNNDNNNTIYANGSLTITLDGSVSQGLRTQVVNKGVGTITFQATGTLDGVGTQITNQYDSVEVIHDGSGNWTVLGPLT